MSLLLRTGLSNAPVNASHVRGTAQQLFRIVEMARSIACFSLLMGSESTFQEVRYYYYYYLFFRYFYISMYSYILCNWALCC